MKKKILIMSLILAAVVSVFAIGAIAAEDEPTLKIEAANLEFADSVYVLYAVSHEGIDAEDVKMLFFTESQTEYIPKNAAYYANYTADGVTVLDKENCLVFKNTALRTKNMADDIYAVAYANVDGEEFYSAPVKYSILQYAYNKLGKTGTASESETLKDMLIDMLAYGASAQRHFDYHTDRPADGDFYQVTVEGGVLADGFTKGLYLAGETVAISAPAEKDGQAFLKWINSAGETVVNTANAEIIVTAQNEVYTATYGEAIRYSEGLRFTSNGDGTCYVSGIGTCTDTDIVIPPVSPQGDTVTSIDNYAFRDCTSLTSVTIPASVTSIGEWAFEECTSLASVFYGGTAEDWDVIVIGGSNDPLLNATLYFYSETAPNVSGNFWHYVDGEIVIWPEYIAPTYSEGLEFISNGDGTCYVSGIGICTDTDIVIPEKSPTGNIVIAISSNAFRSCSSLTSVTIPNSIISIGRYAFAYCSSITSITIPDSVTSISDQAFYNCRSLTSIIVDEANTAYKSIDGNLYSGDGKVLVQYAINKADSSFIIPASVSTISQYAFSYCTNLISVSIPDSVTSIGNEAFWRCSGLTSITIPDSVTSIGGYAFYGCYKITSVNLPDSITSISSHVFYDCKNLTSITIPDSVTSIGSYAFYGCESLTSVTIPNSVTSIGSYAFSSCDSLTSVTIPASVTSIGKYAFYGCTSLTSVKFENPAGWYLSTDANATSEMAITERNLQSDSKAAECLTDTYSKYYWKRG